MVGSRSLLSTRRRIFLSVGRIKNWVFPIHSDDMQNIIEFLKIHATQHTEESIERIIDFANLKQLFIQSSEPPYEIGTIWIDIS